MSCEKGNVKRTRSQKYRNSHAFKNNLHDTSHTTKQINSIQVCNVCERCKKIIEWKIKYKKYKPLKSPAACTKCNQKTVKRAYHTICGPCAKSANVCPKCGTVGEVMEQRPTEDDQIKLDSEMQSLLKKLPERKRRTFLRFINKGKDTEKKKKKKATSEFETVRIPKILSKQDAGDSSSDEYNDECTLKEVKEVKDVRELTRDDLLAKLKSMIIKKDSEDEDDLDSDNYDGGDDDFNSNYDSDSDKTD